MDLLSNIVLSIAFSFLQTGVSNCNDANKIPDTMWYPQSSKLPINSTKVTLFLQYAIPLHYWYCLCLLFEGSARDPIKFVPR